MFGSDDPYGLPGAGSPATSAPETGAPGTGAPETGAPETGAPETGASETAAPGTGAGEAGGSGAVRRFVIEADGGSRGNPGRAGYGALVRDAETGAVLDSEAGALGHATNNVAEYSGLIAALEMARAIDPQASVEVRMDSKLVIEQMAGRWKVKHPDMRPLALRARSVAPPRISWTWVPRERNKAADRLANQAMDGQPRPRAHRLADGPDSPARGSSATGRSATD